MKGTATVTGQDKAKATEKATATAQDKARATEMAKATAQDRAMAMARDTAKAKGKAMAREDQVEEAMATAAARATLLDLSNRHNNSRSADRSARQSSGWQVMHCGAPHYMWCHPHRMPTPEEPVIVWDCSTGSEPGLKYKITCTVVAARGFTSDH